LKNPVFQCISIAFQFRIRIITKMGYLPQSTQSTQRGKRRTKLKVQMKREGEFLAKHAKVAKGRRR